MIYALGFYQACGEFEIFISLLDVAMTAAWVCVCLIPLELYCARRRREEELEEQRELEEKEAEEKEESFVDLEEPSSSSSDSLAEDEKAALLQPQGV